MRTVRRNQRPIFYANWLGHHVVYDEWQNQVGYADVFSPPTLLKANVSANKGEASTRLFGEYLQYDRTILFEGMSPLQETSLLWIPPFDGVANRRPREVPEINGHRIAHNFIVTRIAESLESTNHTVVAVSRIHVTVTHYDLPIEEAPRGFPLVDAIGRPLEDMVGRRLYVLGRPLADAAGRLLEDVAGKQLEVMG